MTRYLAKTEELKKLRQAMCTQERMTELLNNRRKTHFQRSYYAQIEGRFRGVGTSMVVDICDILQCKILDVFEVIENDK